MRVDVHERRSRVPSELERLGIFVEFRRLPFGDYDLGAGVLVERKSAHDLHLTIANGRYWRQVGLLRRHASWPLLLLEGDRIDAGPIDAEAIRGISIATIEQGVAIIRSRDASDSAAWLRRVALRVQRGGHRYRPRFAQIPKSAPAAVPTALLAAVPGISSITAAALLRAFGSVGEIAAADERDWLAVPGMGRRRCAALANALHGRPFPSPSPHRGEGPDPST